MVEVLKKKLFNTSSDEDKQCGICLELVQDFKDSYITDCCGTIFHEKCLKVSRCPMCRTPTPDNIMCDALRKWKQKDLSGLRALFKK